MFSLRFPITQCKTLVNYYLCPIRQSLALSKGPGISKCLYAREYRGAVEVIRVRFASFGKENLFVRVLGGLLFVAMAIVRGVAGPRPDVVLVSNSPPIGPLAGLIIAAWHRCGLVHWLMDINP